MRAARVAAPMGPLSADGSKGVSGIVYATAKGSNVVDVDGNRYVDLAAGFGAMLLGHGHPAVSRVIELEGERLLQALGDVHPSDAKIALLERLSALLPEGDAKVILGQSGGDAVTAAIKTAVLATGRPGILAFRGGYHGLSYAPLAASTLRESYRDPFAPQLNPHVAVAEYPKDSESASRTLEDVRTRLASGDIGAVVVEPVLGRGGIVIPPPGFLSDLSRVATEHGALLVADEIWTGLGRSGAMLASLEDGIVPDVVCLGKGLGGGLPVSACIGKDSVMRAWRREAEVVHTSTFAGAPLACAAAIATFDTLSRERLVERSRDLGQRWLERLRSAVQSTPAVTAVRGRGLMIGLDLGARAGAATKLQAALLEHGYIASTGGGSRETLVLTPPLTVAESLLFEFADALPVALRALG